MLNQKTKKIFVVFLRKSQIKDANKAKKNKEKFDLSFSPIQLKETCFSIISLNNRIEDIKKKKKETIKDTKNNKIKLQLLKEEKKKKLNKINKIKLQILKEKIRKN